MQDIDIKNFKDILAESRSVLLMLPQNPKLDSVAAALGLSLALKESGKEVTTVCPSPMLVEFNRLVGVNNVADSLGNKNLAITLENYAAEDIEKVSYNIEDGKFNLLVFPKPGATAPREDQIKFGYKGTSAQMLIVVGAGDKKELGQFSDNQEVFNQEVKIALVDNNPTHNFQGVMEMINPNKTSVSEVAFQIIEELGLPINQDIANNLFAGIKAGTNNFQGKVNAETFATASRLMRAGAVSAPTANEYSRNIPFVANKRIREQTPPKDWMQPKIFKGSTIS